MPEESWQCTFAALVLRWPGMTGVCGGTWDEHRAWIEKGLHMLSESGEARLAVPAESDAELHFSLPT